MLVWLIIVSLHMTSPQVLPLALLYGGTTIAPLTAGSFAAARYYGQQIENMNWVYILNRYIRSLLLRWDADGGVRGEQQIHFYAFI